MKSQPPNQAAKKAGAPAADEKPEPKGGWTADTWSGLELARHRPGRSPPAASSTSRSTRRRRSAGTSPRPRAASGRRRTPGTTWTPVFDDEGSYSIGCVDHRPAEPERRLGRHRREQQPAQRRLRRRRLQVERRRQELEERRPQGLGAHRQDRRRPARLERRLRRRAGPAVGARAATAASTRRPTAARRGRPCSRSARTPASPTSCIDPRNPDVLYAAAVPAPAPRLDADRRRARVGHPQVDRRRRDLDEARRRPARRRTWAASASPSRPQPRHRLRDRRSAANKAGGFFRSTDRGATWEKRSDYGPSRPQYYQEIFVDPKNADRVYSMDVVPAGDRRRRQDAAQRSASSYKHVDNHAIWIDPATPTTYLVGCDGGLYESFDRGATWHFMANLPVTQFYRVASTTRCPFYNVYGGTQDNFIARRPVAHAERERHRQLRLVRHARAATASSRARRPGGPEHRLRRVAVRRPRALRPEDAASASTSSRSRGRARRPCAGTGTRRSSSARTRTPGSTSPRNTLFRSDDRGDTLEAGQRRPHPPDRPQQAPGHGQGLGRRRGGEERVDVVLRQHRLARRVAAEGGAALRRHRRRPHPGHRGRRQRTGGRSRRFPGVPE